MKLTALSSHLYHYEQFGDVRALLAAKYEQRQRIAVCIPTLNEAETIGRIVSTVRQSLMVDVALVDELLVVDSGSSDATREIAAAAGAEVRLATDISPQHPEFQGKGENLWKALLATESELICYLDGDVANFHVGFVTGLVGPLLRDPSLCYVKAFYERPLATANGVWQDHAGGRVSEILVRPMISAFYPELAGVLQPLSGEYAARRSVLEALDFPVGYGVEIAHLIDLSARGWLSGLAQTDLVRRHHRNRDDGELGDTAYAILRVILRRLERDGKLQLAAEVPEWHQRWSIRPEGATPLRQHLPEPERPPVVSLASCGKL